MEEKGEDEERKNFKRQNHGDRSKTRRCMRLSDGSGDAGRIRQQDTL